MNDSFFRTTPWTQSHLMNLKLLEKIIDSSFKNLIDFAKQKITNYFTNIKNRLDHGWAAFYEEWARFIEQSSSRAIVFLQNFILK